ncbi:MAG: hypothetical protein ABIH21_05375 [Patescibacteria group bacterium]
MSTTMLKFYSTSLSYLPKRYDRQFGNAMRTLRIRVSRRRIKQVLRHYIKRDN